MDCLTVLQKENVYDIVWLHSSHNNLFYIYINQSTKHDSNVSFISIWQIPGRSCMWWCWAATITDTHQRQHCVISRSPTRREETISWALLAHIYGRADLQNTAHRCTTILSKPQQALWPMCTLINNDPHQTLRETNRSYRSGTSTHSTALNCSPLPKGFQSLCPYQWIKTFFFYWTQLKYLIKPNKNKTQISC